MSSSLPAVPPLRSPGDWLLLLPAHLAALLQAFLAACRQHPEQGVPPGWLPVPAGAPLAAVRQAVRRACWQAGVPWLWLVVRPAGGPPGLAALAAPPPPRADPWLLEAETQAAWEAGWRLLLGQGPLVVALDGSSCLLQPQEPPPEWLQPLTGPGRLVLVIAHAPGGET